MNEVDEVKLVTLNGKYMLLNGSVLHASVEDFYDSGTGWAFVENDGDIMRHHRAIGRVEDLKIISAGRDAIIGMFASPFWAVV